MELEQTGESSSGYKVADHAEPELAGPTDDNNLPTDDVECVQGIPTIQDDALMSNSPSFSPSSASFVATEEDFPSRENSPEPMQIASPRHSPVKNHANLFPRLAKTSKCISPSTSSSPSSSMHMSEARAEIRPFPNPATRATYKSPSTVAPRSRSSQSFSVSDDKPPVSKRRKTHHHHLSLDAHTVSNHKPSHRPSSSRPTSSVEVPASWVDPDSISTLEYDLDRDPTQQAYEFSDRFHERSPYSAALSARFIHPHLFERLSGSIASNDEFDPVTESTEAVALGSVGPHDVVNPSYTLGPAEVFGSSGSVPSGYGDLDLEGPVHAADQFPVPSLDDVINEQPDVETVTGPLFLGGTLAFPEPRPPSPTPFRDVHLWKRARTSSPPLVQSASAIPSTSRTPASTSGSDSVGIPRDSGGILGAGKAKFYKKGTLQVPPHLSNSQHRRSLSAGTAESIRTNRYPPPDQVAPTEIDSPLTEFSASDWLAGGITSVSSAATPSKSTSTVEEGTTVINGWSSAPPRVNDTKRPTVGKQKRSAGQKGPYRVVAVNESTNCHQCRRTTPKPKMSCRACAKQYCILCIVKRYHDIEFHQFKKDFDCPACLNVCNCTACCCKRRVPYITTRHIQFDGETMAKLLSGEIRSLPHLSAAFAGPHVKPKLGQDPVHSRRKEPSSTARKGKPLAKRKRAPSRRYNPHDDDFDESDASNTQEAGVRAKPVKAALQTQRMLEESGSGRYWGAVYSLNGERIGMSYVGNNLQNVTLQTIDFSSASVTDSSSPPSRQRRKRVYVGRWQDTWDSRPETLDEEDETRANKRSRDNKELGHARFYYVGNQKIIRAWRNAQSKAVKRPPVGQLPPSDDAGIRTPPSGPRPLDKPSASDHHEVTSAPPNNGIPVGAEEEDEDDSRNFWIMEDRSSPGKRNPPLHVAADVPRPGLGNISDVPDICPTSTLESCGQLVTQEDLVTAVASGLQAVGTTVLLPEPPLLGS